MMRTRRRVLQAVAAVGGALFLVSLAGATSQYLAVVIALADVMRAVDAPEGVAVGAAYAPSVLISLIGAALGWRLARPDPGPARKAIWVGLAAVVLALIGRDLFLLLG
ncbi:hypothetical protein [Acuticoccus sp.]|uniref:hypothetical protein n=1 Tax=Acuticoccus sp. TaxID=1904378 RepID=UPI003B52026D